MTTTTYIRWFDDLDSDDVPRVGGKNASLGEMIRELKEREIRVPDGFATTADAYRRFLEHNELDDRLREALDKLADDGGNVDEVGETIRELILDGDFPEELAEAIDGAYEELSKRYSEKEVDVAVRSSATAEDLPEASFAGQQESFLNIRGKDELRKACRQCYASLFTDRAISYREEQGFDHLDVALSVGVQKMVRADKASAGVMFTLDTESGFPDVVVINGGWGLGETVVGGTITPDEFRVFKPLLKDGKLPIIDKKVGAKQKRIVASSGEKATREEEVPAEERRQFTLNDEEILQLARWAVAIEEHYGKAMDIEWAKDGETDELFIVQARPETVQSQKAAATLKHYSLKEKGEVLVEGLAVGDAIAAGPVSLLKSLDDQDRFEKGAILVTEMTDPDWVPLMRTAAAIVTNKGGRTSHAAIVSRELGVPAIIGTENGTEILSQGQSVTVSCAEGETGRVYDGELDYEAEDIDLSEIPETKTKVMMNLASPDAAFRWWNLPVQGIGLARMEFIINNTIKIHPLALTRFDELDDKEAREQIERMTSAYEEKTNYFVDFLARGIARIAASQYPKPTVLRLSDFKTNEYAQLIGGSAFEPQEENPMLGFRGASRYYSDEYRDGFKLECRAIKLAREEIGLDNIIVMVPFCRTPEEADKVLQAMEENGLKRGEHGFQVYVMAEIPSNIILAEQFADRFDGFSIGTNDLTQLLLGVDRDSDRLADLFDERHPAVKQAIRHLIQKAHAKDTPVGICGQAPSDYPDFAAFLVEAGIDSISVNPDSVLEVLKVVAEAEAEA